MACRVEPPSDANVYYRKTAKLLAYVYSSLDLGVPRDVLNAAAEPFCFADFSQQLCARLKAMTPDQISGIVYNARDPDSRRLADWWEEHQENDARHAKEEQNKIKKQELQARALEKLTPEERAAFMDK